MEKIENNGIKSHLTNGFYTLKKGFIIRLEFFGGLIVDTTKNDYYSTNHEDGLFLIILEEVKSLESAYKIFQKIITDYQFDITQYKKFLHIVYNCEDEKFDLENYVNKFKLIYIKSKNNKFLSAPLDVTIYPTLKCQLKCEFCYIKNAGLKSQDELSLDDFKKILLQIKELKIPYLSILGGEPTLYKDIVKVIDFIGQNEIDCSITTNGFDLTDEFLNTINKYKCIGLVISLQSLDSYNKEVTGADAERIINNIKRAGKDIKINMVYRTQTVQQIFDMIEFCCANQIEYLGISLYNNPHEDNLKEIKKFKDFKRLKKIVEDYVRKKELNLAIRFEGCNQFFYYKFTTPKTEIEKLLSKCEAGNIKIEILPNGDVLPCVILDKDSFIAGNVFTNSIKDVWNNSKILKLLREEQIMDQDCINCIYVDFCNGGCPAKKWFNYKSLSIGRDKRCLGKK